MERLNIEFDRLTDDYVKLEFLAGEIEEIKVTDLTEITDELARLTTSVENVKTWAKSAASRQNQTEMRKFLRQHLERAYARVFKGNVDEQKQQGGSGVTAGPVDRQEQQLNLSIQILGAGDSDDDEESEGNANNAREENAVAAHSTPQGRAKLTAGSLLYMPMIVDEESKQPIPILASDGQAKVWPITESLTESRKRGKVISVRDWKLKFDGDSKSELSFAEFLREFELKKSESNLTDREIWLAAHNLFVGQAITWFMANRECWGSWADFVPDFLQNFKPPNYDKRLWHQLRWRTQGVDERLNIYVVEMKQSFSLLAKPPSDAEKLEFIIARLNPVSLDKLPLEDIHSLHDLVREGLKLEKVQCRIQTYKEPQTPDNHVEPKLVYRYEEKKRANEKKTKEKKACAIASEKKQQQAASASEGAARQTEGKDKKLNYVPDLTEITDELARLTTSVENVKTWAKSAASRQNQTEMRKVPCGAVLYCLNRRPAKPSRASYGRRVRTLDTLSPPKTIYPVLAVQPQRPLYLVSNRRTSTTILL
ncbi:uncharacterized protein LOC135937603 [Cloeon dipterum]|uniref:uncharacterized protein LOC135937603 n=1 Tax=Cloeon dipterum TaxID=197152 RepID=UPI00321FEC07